MLTVQETERYTGVVYDNEFPVAKLYKLNNGVKVHMYTDDYEFETESIDTAIKLIKIRWEKP